eukprot:SAG22_NODE_5642_length_978_cov_2.324232_2_plen_85_part_00
MSHGARLLGARLTALCAGVCSSDISVLADVCLSVERSNQVLPFLNTPKTVVFLYPCVLILASYVLLLVTRHNLTIGVLTWYFGS